MRTRILIPMLSLLAAVAIAVPAANAKTTLKFFLSPTGNIACSISTSAPAQARCDINKHTFKAKAKHCQLDSGDSVGVDATGKGYLVCHGDTVFGHYAKLAYGHSITFGQFKCSSSTRGIACINQRTNHGFSIAQQDYDLF